jgi:DNA polymerase/3'-5' exonuclease PolX
MMLAEVNEQLAEAERRLSSGTPIEKVKAAGELSFLRRQKETIADRVKEIDAAPKDASETLFRWVKEEVFNLKLRTESWIARG